MPRVQSRPRQTAEIAFDAGNIGGESPYVWIDQVERLGSRGTEHIFAILEPIEPSYDPDQVVPEVLDVLRQEIADRNAQTATAAILGAVEATNAWLYDINRERAAGERLLFGMTCVLARDDELYIAQAQPSQILIGQEGELYAFPSLETWRWPQRESDQETAAPGSQPLGARAEIEPELYHTRIDRGDVIVLVSASLARVIGREEQEVFVGDEVDAIAMHLEDLAVHFGLESAHAAVIAVTESSAPARVSPEYSLLRRVGDICTHFLPEETAERIRSRTKSPRQEVDLDRTTGHTLEYPDDASAVGTDLGASTEPSAGTAAYRAFNVAPEMDDDEAYAPQNLALHYAARTAHAEDIAFDDADEEDDARWSPVADDRFVEDDDPADEEYTDEGRGKLTELLAGAMLALSAAVVGVWQLTVHRERSLGEPRDDGTLGLPRLHRYKDRTQLPDLTGLRARLPRAPISRLTAVVAVVLVFCLAGALVFSVHSSRVRARQAKVEQLLQASVQEREQAAQATDPNVAQAHLLAAEARVREAKASGLDPTRASQEEAAISAARDKSLHIERLSNIQVLGGVPAAPAGVTPRVFFGNGQVYVFTDALYRLDGDGTKLVRLIGSGDQVGGSPVGTLLGATWGDGSPIAFDGNNAYLFDPTKASWSRQPLGTVGSAYTGIAEASGFGGNLYFLSPGSGQILKFHAGAFNNQPEDWTGGQAANELHNAVDMQIDGRIYVLLKDGKVLDFFMSALESTTPTTVTPPIENAVALSAQPDRQYVYIADSHDRILRVDRKSGDIVQQFMAAEGSPGLTGIKDIAVDDVQGVGYILTDKALLQVRLPAPPH